MMGLIRIMGSGAIFAIGFYLSIFAATLLGMEIDKASLGLSTLHSHWFELAFFAGALTLLGAAMIFVINLYLLSSVSDWIREPKIRFAEMILPAFLGGAGLAAGYLLVIDFDGAGAPTGRISIAFAIQNARSFFMTLLMAFAGVIFGVAIVGGIQALLGPGK